MIDAAVGLGTSLGPRRRNLDLALAALAATPGVELRAVSRVYLSPPAGGVARGTFLNAALRLGFPGGPLELLALCHAIERRAGRRPAPRWADRVLDLDLLHVADLTAEGPELHLPHPRLRERPFAWAPLLDVWPGLMTPGPGRAPAAVGVLARPAP